MADPWDEIRDEAVGVVKDALKGFVENNKEVDDFVKEKASQYAREFWLSRNSATAEERKEHSDNLAHVQAQVRMNSTGSGSLSRWMRRTRSSGSWRRWAEYF